MQCTLALLQVVLAFSLGWLLNKITLALSMTECLLTVMLWLPD